MPNEEESSSNQKISNAVHQALKDEKPFLSYAELFKFGCFLIPFIVSFSIWLSSMDKRLSLVEDKQSIILEIKDDIKSLKNDVNSIKIEIAKIQSSKSDK